MKNKINLLICSLIITIGLFIYLTYHHYAVQLGLNSPGVCSINEALNCDAAAASSYSEIFQIPIALLGLCFSFIMLVVVLFKKWGWSEESSSQNGLIRILFGVSAMASIALAAISVFEIRVGCPFCMGTYIFSFINLYLVWSVFSPSDLNPIGWIPEKGTWIIGGTILVMVWLISGAVQDNYGLNEIKRMLPEKAAQWRNAKVFEFSSQLGIVENPEAAITVVEFADFKCPHCKVGSQSMNSFMQGRKDVKFVFKTFPLDGNCNPHIQFKGDGSRCKMAAWTLCADKVAKKGWDVNHWYFENQERLMSVADLKETNTELSKKFNFNYEEVETCSESVTTLDEIKKMCDEGNMAQIGGTPALFVNGKQLAIAPQFFSIGLKSIVDTLK